MRFESAESREGISAHHIVNFLAAAQRRDDAQSMDSQQKSLRIAVASHTSSSRCIYWGISIDRGWAESGGWRHHSCFKRL